MRDFGEVLRFTLRDEFGHHLEGGDFRHFTTIDFSAEAQKSYFLDVFAGSAIYKLDIEGASYALKTNVTDKGLHLQNELTPLYLFVPNGTEKISITIGSNQIGETAAAEFISPSGRVTYEVDTTGHVADRIVVNNPTEVGNFWTLIWKSPRGGNVDDVWVKIGAHLPQWVIIDPEKPLIVLSDE
jgi:hypothetical protein